MSNVLLQHTKDRNDPLPIVPSACHRAFNILEVLERILFLVPPAQLLTLRFVSRHWDRATYRPLWQYPDFAQRGMDKITPQLVQHGRIVQELDFYKASLFRENPLQDVETLKTLCPNVRSLRMPFGCLTFAGVQHLIQFYGLKSVGPLSLSSESGEGRAGQLHTLSLDMSTTEYQPEGIEWLTDLGGGLRRLELRLNRKREGSTRQRTSFLQFEPLLASCGGIRELVILPTPHFLPSSDEKFRLFMQGQHPTLGAQLTDHIHGVAPKLRTSDTLKLFEQYQPPLRLLHLARVWFSDMDLEVLGRACPGIDDLRLTNLRMDLSSNEWNIRSIEMPDETEDRTKDELSIEVILKCWPGMKVLRLDGHLVRMFSAATRCNLQVPVSPPSSLLSRSGSTLQAAATTSSPSVEANSEAAPPTPTTTSKTSLFEEDLMTLVDLVEPTLTYLNVDKNPQLTDQTIRHVLMTCSNLRDLSASELDLTMGVFEDDDPSERQQQERQREQEQDIQDVVGKLQGLRLDESLKSAPLSTKGLEPATKKPWACIKTLRSLDFSWRIFDGRPAYLPSSSSSTVKLNESHLPPYRHHAHHHRHHRCQQQQHPRDNGQGTSAPQEAEAPISRMFATPWHIESIYERLRVLERLEVLQLEGWTIPWRAADIEAFLGHSSEPELVSKKNQFQEDKIAIYLPWELYKGTGRCKEEEAASLEEYKDADFAYIAMSNSIIKDKLIFQAPGKDTLSWQASQGVGGQTVDRADLLPLPTSRMSRLRLLNVLCRKPVFLDNPTGPVSPFVLYPPCKLEDESKAVDINQELEAEYVTTPNSVPPPPPPPPPRSGFRARRSNATNTSIESAVPPVHLVAAATPRRKPTPLQHKTTHITMGHVHGVVASFMKACPNLERVLIAKEGNLSSPFHQTDFTIQLGCSKKHRDNESVDDGGKGSKSSTTGAAILDDPATAILRVSPRRVLCTRRLYPELTTRRRY
ncbi:hypothetical protein BGZ95_007961 [Linnemannia exigua]|uniref:F-box domain-containing protein n=1 Tax=Linnemannia exigua TaxID=604196 RepID=A0AAD4DL94_9FUNG|nr:hypothetical protein BGZ95_007961 [Linnemannia exigua]